MAWLEIHPEYRDRFAALGLRAAEDFLALRGVICCGHPDRNVARVTVAGVDAYLKCEYRVRWKDRVAGAWAGFGFVSKSRREYRILSDLAAAGICCPEPLAAGEDRAGRAFLLLRTARGSDLREYLRTVPPAERRAAARRLGAAVARIHAAGFDHPDLYSKHVLVTPEGDFGFLDWQRSRRGGRPGGRRRWRDLAALDATLADELASPRDRLAFLAAYLRASDIGVTLREAAREIRRRARALQRRRRVRELLHPARVQQALIRLDGEALSVTPEYFAEVGGRPPEWLCVPAPGAMEIWRGELLGPCGLRRLVRRARCRVLRWLGRTLLRRPHTSPELELAGTIFRLQRYGIITPRLLAVGQRQSRPWRTESMLFTEDIPNTIPLTEWLTNGPHVWRRAVAEEAVAVVRRIADAGYRFRDPAAAADALAVQYAESGPCVVLSRPEALRRLPWGRFATCRATWLKVQTSPTDRLSGSGFVGEVGNLPSDFRRLETCPTRKEAA